MTARQIDYTNLPGVSPTDPEAPVVVAKAGLFALAGHFFENGGTQKDWNIFMSAVGAIWAKDKELIARASAGDTTAYQKIADLTGAPYALVVHSFGPTGSEKLREGGMNAITMSSLLPDLGALSSLGNGTGSGGTEEQTAANQG